MHNQRMIYGYSRVSSNGQDLAQQLAQLEAAGFTKIYREKISGATAERPQLKRAMGTLDAGDLLMVTSTNRLARNTRDLLNILHAVKEAGAGFRSIAEPMVDTTSQFADVITAVLGVAANYERHGITARTAAGRVQAKARGVKFGRRAAFPLTSRPKHYSGSPRATRSVPLPPCSRSIRRRYQGHLRGRAERRGLLENGLAAFGWNNLMLPYCDVVTRRLPVTRRLQEDLLCKVKRHGQSGYLEDGRCSSIFWLPP